MESFRRSSASNRNCVQGILDEPGNSSTKLIAFFQIMTSSEFNEMLWFEVYADGTVIADPFDDAFTLHWEDDLYVSTGTLSFCYDTLTVHGYLPQVSSNILLRKTYAIFEHNHTVYFKALGSVYKCEPYNEDPACDLFYVQPRGFSISDFISSDIDVCLKITMESQGLQIQSGTEEYNEDLYTEYKYSKSKVRRRWKNQQLVCSKLTKVKEDLAAANLGSRKKNTKKLFIKKLKSNHVKPQAGKEDKKIDTNTIVSFFEKLFGVFAMKYYDHPIITGLSALLMLCKNSLSFMLYDSIKDIINSVKDCSGTFSDLSNWLKTLVVDIEKFKTNKFAQKFMELLLKIWTTLLCPSILVEWSEKILHGSLSKIFECFSGLGNPIECIIWAVTYVVNGVDVFIKDGVMDGFLSTETLTDSLSDRVRVIRQDFKLYATGDLEFIKGYKHYGFLHNVEQLRKDLQSIRKSKRGIDLKLVDDWLKEVDSIQVECQRVEAQTGSRIQPYHFILTSGSGISKSHLLKLMCHTIARSNSIPATEEYVYYVNQANKFQSGWANHKTVIMIDDSAAMHADATTSASFLNMADWVLRSDNNVPHELLGADIKEKGTLFDRALIQGWASNSFTQDFEKYARFASAVNRRIHTKIVGEVRPQYLKQTSSAEHRSTSIDYKKLSEDDRAKIAPDAWTFTCYECEIADQGVNVKSEFGQPVTEYDALHRWVPIIGPDGKEMKDRNIEETLKFLVWHSSNHYANQRDVLDIGKKVYDEGYYCCHGFPINLNCDKCIADRDKCPLLKIYDGALESISEEGSCLSGEEEVILEPAEQLVDLGDSKINHDPIVQPASEQLPDDEASRTLPDYKTIPIEEVIKNQISEQLDRESFVDPYERATMYLQVKRLSEDLENIKNRLESDIYTEVPEIKTEASGEPRLHSNYSLSSAEEAVSLHFMSPGNADVIKCSEPDLFDFDKGSILLAEDTIKYSLMCQSGVERKRVKYCKKLIDKILSMKLNDIGSRILSSKDLLAELRRMGHAVKSVLQDWFSGLVCDVISYLSDMVFEYVERFCENPWAFIPSSLEDTMLSHYMYSTHPKLKIALWKDYVLYKLNYWFENRGRPPSQHICCYYNTRSAYVEHVRTRTRLEDYEETLYKPMSMREFALKAISQISGREKETKMEWPDLMRDAILPLGLSYVVVTSFIPALIEQFSNLYCDVQVGYDMSVDEVKTADRQAKDDWYKAKQEIFLSKPSVEVSRTYSELESATLKNVFFIRNTCNKKIVSALSFANHFIIMPYHYVRESYGHVLQCLKTEISSYDLPGNAIIEFQLCERMVFKLPGDLCVVYVEKAMDHMRTKDILDSFPTERMSTPVVGRLVYRKTLGQPSKLDATSISYSSDATNSTEPFPGYYYFSDNFMGLCGAVLVDESRKVSSILGIHVGGDEKTRLSVACCVLRQDLEASVQHFTNGLLIQSGLDFTKLPNYIPNIYRHNPFLDTTDRLDGVELLGSAIQRYSFNDKIVYTPICDDVKTEFKVDYSFVAPPFKFGGDKRHGVRQLIRAYSQKTTVRDMNILRVAQQDLEDQFMAPLRQNTYWRDQIRALNDFEIVNGVAGKKFLGGVNMSTAMGGGKQGSKSLYATQATDGSWTFDPWVLEEVAHYEDQMDRGIITPDIVVQQLKLQATEEDKAAIGKLRSFFMASTIIQLVLRRVALTTCRYACMNTKYTEIVVGINAHSTDWTKFVLEITKHGKNRMIALDLANMDATVMFEVLSGCIDIFFKPFNEVCNKDGRYTNRLAVLKHMLLFPLIDVHGDLVCMSGLLPSGTPLTSMLGCLINSTYYRMAFYYMYNGPRTFVELVTLRVYGDDSIANVHPDANFFTVSAVLKAWDALGIRGTDMEKKNTTSRRKFYKLDDVEFLKRKMLYNKDFGVVVAPLLKKSMFKCLMCHVPPRTVSLEFLTGQCIDNFLFEAKFHGRQFYEESRRKLRIIATKHDLLRFCNVLSISYSEIVEKWKEVNNECALVTEQWWKCQPPWLRLVHEFNVGIQNWSEWTQHTNINITKDQSQSVVKLVVTPDRVQLVQQSGVESSVRQVVSFLEADKDQTLVVGSADNEDRISNDPVDLKDFLSRPVKVASWQWGPSTFNQVLDPWTSLLTNKRIANRISNYNLFKAKCHVKIVVNGNGFFYGRMMVTYLPFQALANRLQIVLNPDAADADFVSISQRPKVFLDPTISEGAEMILPFYYPWTYLSLTDDTEQWKLGELAFNAIVNLKHANQNLVIAQQAVTITVYAWFEDVDLQGPTIRNISSLTPQSGRECESINKPISQTATNIANVASAVKQIPVLAPYASAVEKAATITSSVASALGYSKPVAVAEPAPLVPRIVGSMAVTNTTSSAMKLTLDVKQETSISPLDVNLKADDELAFSSIAGHDSYLNRFVWSRNAAPGTMLMNYKVSPYLSRTVGIPAKTYMTAMCGVAACFKHWSGSIIYRFQIVKSAFHRGRLLIVYDPKDSVAVHEDNVHFTHVVDIGETSDFEIKIGNYQEREWLTEAAQPWYTEVMFSPSPLQTSGSTDAVNNGLITIYVLNDLTTPTFDETLNNDIHVVCYVRAGDDFKVSVPTTIADFSTVGPQSGIEMPFSNSLEVADDVGSGLRSESHSHEMIPMGNKLYMGETVTSFRNLLKRDNYYSAVTIQFENQAEIYAHPAQPLYPDIVNGFPRTGATSNECLMTMVNYVKLAFSGYKGGIRWKLLNCGTTKGMTTAIRDYIYSGSSFQSDTFNYTTAGAWRDNIKNHIGRQVMCGSGFNHTSINPLIEFEMPYQTANKFQIVQTISPITTTFKLEEPVFIYGFIRDASATKDNIVYMFVSAAEDFTCYFFLGWVPVYIP